MKILLYSLIFAPDVCSNAYVFSDMAKEMKRQGHNVTVITTTPHYDEKTSAQKKAALLPGQKLYYRRSVFEGIQVYHIDVPPKKGSRVDRVKTFYRLHKYATRVIKDENIEADIVLAQTPPPIIAAVDCHRLAKKLHAKSVLILQDLWVDSMVKKGKLKEPFRTILQSVERKQYNKLDAVCTISAVMANVVSQKLDTKERLHIIPNFVDTTVYHPTAVTPEMRAKYGISENDFVISYVGNIGNAQDLMPLLEYAKAHQNDNIKVLIAGNGTKEEYYRQMMDGVGNVKFLGYVPREETLQINAVSDVCLVMLAKHVIETSFPSKIYTIMAMRKPILITCGAKSAAGQFIEENSVGWSVRTDSSNEFEQVMRELIKKPKAIDTYGENALKLIHSEYSQNVVIEKYIKLFKKLLG